MVWSGARRPASPKHCVAPWSYEAKGWTCDVSGAGVFSIHTGVMKMICTSVIVRVGPKPAGIGLAAHITSFDFISESVSREWALTSWDYGPIPSGAPPSCLGPPDPLEETSRVYT
jgi:hypothetical protein